MAMKVKQTHPQVNPVLGAYAFDSVKIEESIKAAVEGLQKPSAYLVEHNARTKRKQQPRQKVARRKPTKKDKPTVVKQAPSSPTNPMSGRDEEHYALWWDFVKDRTFLSVPYPIRPEDKANGLRKQRNSQRSHTDRQALRAVGITPRGDNIHTTNVSWKVGSPVGSVCHEAAPEFKQVVDENSAYIKELSARYCLTHGVEKDVLSLMVWGARQAIETQSVDNSQAIHVLEDMLLVEQPTIIEYGSPTSAQIRQDLLRERAEAVVFDMDLPTSCASNESVFSEAESQYEKEQWPDEINYTLYQTMCAGNRMVDVDLVAYVQWHNEAELREPTTNQFLVDLKDMSASDADVQGRMYAQWLVDYTTLLNKQANRDNIEQARKTVDPMYIMDTGLYIHPLAQSNPAQFKKLTNVLRKASKADRTKFDSAGDWYTYSTYVANVNPIRRAAQEKQFLSNVNKGIYTDKIISHAYRRDTFKVWVNINELKWPRKALTSVAEEATHEDIPTIHSKVDPISDHKETEVVSTNVINLMEVRNQRQESVQALLSRVKSKVTLSLNNYSEEEKVMARRVLNDILEALG